MAIEPKYQDDKDLIDSLCPNELARFELWFAELNAENLKQDRTFYSGERLEVSTGIKCWFDFFVDGYLPLEALAEDLTNA